MDIEKLIVCVHSKNALWDQKSKDYHNRNLTQRLWEEVGQEMKETAAAIKTKWRTLRDNYRKELNKMHSRSGAEGGKKPKWVYFELMSFLMDTVINRPSSGNISIENGDVQSQSQDDIGLVSNQSDELIRHEEEEDDARNEEEERDKEIENFRTPAGEKRVSEEKIAFQSKKKKVQNIYDRLLAVEEQKLDKLTSMCTKTDQVNTMDSDYMFLMSLLPQMKSLPSLRNMYMRQKIQQLFINEHEMLQASINTTARSSRELPEMSPVETHPCLMNVEMDAENIPQPSTSNVRGYFHTFQ